MTKRIALVLVVLALALAASGCSISPSTTPTGNPCTLVNNEFTNVGCYYFISNGTAVACHVNVLARNYCQNTSGEFYIYHDGTTALCENRICSKTAAVSTPESCSPEFTYNNLTNDGQAWQAVNQLEDQNTTGQPITTRFISSSATSISTTASISLTANADAVLGVVFVSVRAQINASVARTASTVVGNEVTVTIPPGMTAYGIYGVKVQVARGHLYQSNSCGTGKIDYGDVQAYVPIAAGWCVWQSGQTPCRVVTGN